MSKKHKKNKWLKASTSENVSSQPAGQPGPSISHAEALEQRIIKTDLIRLLVINLVVLGVLLALFYSNKNSGYLQTGLEKFLHLN